MKTNTNQNVVIRNKKDVEKLSNQVLISLEESRNKRLMEAIQDDDMLYLSVLLGSISTVALIKIVISKIIHVFFQDK